MQRSLAVSLVVALGACGGSEGPALAPGAVKAFEKPFYNSLAESYSLDVVDLAREGDLVVMTMLYGWTTFFEHSAGCAEFCSPNGSSAQNGGYYLAVSRDGGATFTSSPLVAAAGVGGEPYGVQLHGGRAWILLGRANGTQLELHMLLRHDAARDRLHLVRADLLHRVGRRHLPRRARHV